MKIRQVKMRNTLLILRMTTNHSRKSKNKARVKRISKPQTKATLTSKHLSACIASKNNVNELVRESNKIRIKANTISLSAKIVKMVTNIIMAGLGARTILLN